MSSDETWDQIEAAREVAALYDERAVTAAWLDQQDFPALEWTVEGILPEGMGLLAAPPKVGKSWLVNNVALACAAGGVALGAIPVKRRPVLLLALEDGYRRLQSRFRTLMEGKPLPEGLEVVTRASANEALVLVDEFLRRQRSAAPLVIVDTLGKIKPPRATNEDAYQADYRIGGALKRRIDEVPGGCLLLVHHTRKAETADFIDSVSGTQAIAGSADFVLVLTRRRQAADAVLSVTGRDVLENEYALVTQDGRWKLDGMDLMDAAARVEARQQQARLGDRSLELLAYITSCGEKGASIGDAAKATGIDYAQTKAYLARMVEAGTLVRPRRGLYMNPVTSVTSVTSDQESEQEGNGGNGGNAPMGGRAVSFDDFDDHDAVLAHRLVLAALNGDPAAQRPATSGPDGILKHGR